MPQEITVVELFKAAELPASGPVCWGEGVPEKSPGVYVVAVVGAAHQECDAIDVGYLAGESAKLWISRQPIIYIGRTKRSLSRRIGEFYKHKHGEQRPHRGGQNVLLLMCPRWVYWSATECPAAAEERMIEYFKAKVGQLPFGNRVRSARVNTEN